MDRAALQGRYVQGRAGGQRSVWETGEGDPGDARVEDPGPEEEVGGFEHEPSVVSRIDAEIGEEAIFEGEGRQHAGGEALLTRAAQALQAGRDEDGRMTVEGGADLQPFADGGQDALDHPRAGFRSRLAHAITVV